MEEMIDHCAQFVDEVNKMMSESMTQEQYKDMMRGFFPMLKRWRTSSPNHQ
jgi:hypothetical protein